MKISVKSVIDIIDKYELIKRFGIGDKARIITQYGVHKGIITEITSRAITMCKINGEQQEVAVIFLENIKDIS